MKFSTLTLNQAKMHLSNYVLDEFGFSADNIISVIESSKTTEDLQNLVNKLVPHLKADQAKELMGLWMEITSALKRA